MDGYLQGCSLAHAYHWNGIHHSGVCLGIGRINGGNFNFNNRRRPLSNVVCEMGGWIEGRVAVFE